MVIERDKERGREKISSLQATNHYSRCVCSDIPKLQTEGTLWGEASVSMRGDNFRVGRLTLTTTWELWIAIPGEVYVYR